MPLNKTETILKLLETSCTATTVPEALMLSFEKPVTKIKLIRTAINSFAIVFIFLNFSLYNFTWN